jgi:hypothetical protein
MKTKIFNAALFAVLAFMAVSAKAFAQGEPPTPPDNIKLNKSIDDKEYRQKMAELTVKMTELSKEMVALSAKQRQHMAIVMKDLDKKLTSKFKDFGKNFSGSFNGMVPEVNNNINTDDYNNVNLNTNNEEYKTKIANGQISEKIKNYSKTYSVSGGDVLQIDNKFGKVTVNTWNRNEFKVDVQMKFASEDADEVNDMIRGSGISDSKVGSIVSFKTNIYKNENRSGREQNMAINYTVYMPAGNPLDVSNKFGDVTLPDLSGKAVIKVQFGNLNAQRLTNAQNDVQIKFTQDKTSTIALFNGGKLKVDFSKLKAGILDNVEASFSFSDIDIARLKGTATMNIKFGDGVSIGAIDKGAKSININANNTKVDIDFKQSPGFNFDVTTRYGGFNVNDDSMKVTSKTPLDEDRGFSSTKTYKGYIVKNGTDNNIVINGRFTDIRFN